MNRLRLAGGILLAIILMIPQAPVAVQAQAPEATVVTTFVPSGGAWTGKTNLGYAMSFTVTGLGTSWSGFLLFTRVLIGGCSAVVTSNTSSISGPITANQFSWTGINFRFTGKFTSATAASGTYAFTNQQVLNCSNKRFSQTGTWTAKAPFGKLGPANSSTGRPVTPILSWGAAMGAATYNYCVDTASHVDGDTVCNSGWKGNGSLRSVTLAALAENTTYFWQIRARNSVGTIIGQANSGIWWSFTTGTLPAAFGKTSPSNGATGQVLASTLSWSASTGASSYQYCFDTTNDSVCNGTWTSTGTATTVDPPGVFLPGKTYYWQVKAVNPVGTTGADGAWWSFATVPPSVLTLTSARTQDGWILESSETSGIGGKANAIGGSFFLGDDAGKRQYRGILSFATGSLPPGAVITSVTLRIKKSSGTPVGPFGTLGNILVDVKKGTFNTSALQVTDFQASASRLGVMAIANAPVAGWYSKAMAAANFPYINRNGPTQFRLRFAKDDNNNFVANYLGFFSGDATTLTNRPQLVIQYYIP